MNQLKFQLDYLPEKAHYNNLRYLVKPTVWKHIIDAVRKERNYTCEFCNKKFNPSYPKYLKYLECHEYWVFNVKEQKQKLKKLLLLCHYCHQTQHMGFSSLHNNEEKIIKHFMKVNKLTISDFNELKRKNLLFRNSIEDEIQMSKTELENVSRWILYIDCDLKKYLPEKLNKDEFINFLNNLSWGIQ